MPEFLSLVSTSIQIMLICSSTKKNSHPKLDSAIAPGCYERHSNATRFHCILSLLYGGVIEGQNI